MLLLFVVFKNNLKPVDGIWFVSTSVKASLLFSPVLGDYSGTDRL